MTLRYATVTNYPEGCFSTFRDGTTWAAQPSPDPHYTVIAHRCGYGDDILAYCREHEIAHHIVGERFFGGTSPVLWELAHGGEVAPEEAALEECMVMALQRYVRAGEWPIIGGVDWGALRDQMLETVQ